MPIIQLKMKINMALRGRVSLVTDKRMREMGRQVNEKVQDTFGG